MKRFSILMSSLILFSACQSTQPDVFSRSAGNSFGAAAQKPFDEMTANARPVDPIAGCIYFGNNQSELSAAAKAELNRIASLLSSRSGSAIVEGHADGVSEKDSNTRLSCERALAAANYLANAGVWEERLVVRGFGESRPAANNETEAGRALNRRVVVKTFAQGDGMTGKEALIAQKKKMSEEKTESSDSGASSLDTMLQALGGGESEGK
ncbi:MAG: OmpA family protein [Candidatus Omnitrophota bacterium]